MAIEMSFSDASEFCQKSNFADRICVAASNSPKSVTLSGDADAIREAQGLLETSCSAKLLRVDKAYHSYHMNSSAEPYLRSLRACDLQVCSGDPSCVWISSITGDYIANQTRLKDMYWVDNMVQPVLFAQAIGRAMRDAGPFEAIIEVGPHPTLEAPVTQTVNSVMGSTAPYCALLRRGYKDVESF